MVTARSEIIRGTVDMVPLMVAVIPWGILVGAYGIESGLTALETQALSLFVFAGTSQLVAIGMMEAGAGFLSILITTLLITSRHLLYSMALRNSIKGLSLRWRSTLGFLLTDELFVNTQREDLAFNRWYALGGGFSFYLAWNLATLFGVIAGEVMPDLTHMGLDFAVVATFIAIVVPMVKSRSVLACVIVSTLVSVYCSLQELQMGLLISIAAGMAAGYLSYKVGRKA